MRRPRRELGYRLLGPLFDYLLHLRPAEWPIVSVHFLTGTALAVQLGGLAELSFMPLLLGTLAFVIGVNGGTLALNSAFDRDEGDIAYLRDPPRPPRGLALLGVGLMLLAVLAAHDQPRAYMLPVLICVALSVLYSVPPIRLKAVPGVDWVINMAGFGFLTPYAGWTLSGMPLTTTGAMVMAGFALLFGALYPLTQLYQLDEDRRRGDRTFASVLGVSGSLGVSIGCTVLAFLGFVVAGTRSAWSEDSAPLVRWLGLGLAAVAWSVVLVPWFRRGTEWDSVQHQHGMHRALGAWAVTDIAVLFAFAR